MKAAVYSKAEAGKILEIRDLDQPLPKDNEAFLRVRAASVRMRAPSKPALALM
ncbi:MAG TPA: hypothetical protein VFO46_05415 [Candidatus Sulfotelmatobacter sp.]|nr:hypothetical protein [Candidatus Sulfotelmatobacter sp.]